MGDIKSFLHQWCAKNGKKLQINVRSTGSKNGRFLCELRVSGIDYVGAGKSTNKKVAQRNAVKKYVDYLVRTNRVSPNDVPRDSATLSGAMEMDNSYLPESQDVNVNSGIHGNWTIENAKSKLHQFMQTNKISADYKYTLVGPNHTRRFMAEMSIYIKQLGRNIYGCENGSNKRTASKNCALSIVRQLYHLGVIETFGGTLEKNKDVEQMKPYLVKMSPELESQIQDVLVNLNIKPIDVKQLPTISEEDSMSNNQGVSLLTNQVLDDFIPTTPQPAGVVSWSPPQPNRNPWTGRNIDKGPLASMSLDQMSEYLMNEQRKRLKQDISLQAIIEKRNKMPVFAKRNEIMNAIKENGVVIIHGNTGCGKTTQVCQIILDDYIASGQGAYCNIIVTQPKKISVLSVADRVATERRETLGQSIGYATRTKSCFPRPYASMIFCTVNVLLVILKKNGLRGITHVIVDEIQERNVDSDFIMVVLRDMINLYPDLRIILLSATIDTTLFSEYFINSSIVEIRDRAHPVKQYFLEDCFKMTRFVPPRVSRKRKYRVSDNLSIADGEPEKNLNKVIGNEYSIRVKNAMAQITEKHISFELIDEILIYITKRFIPGNVLIFLPNWSLISALMRHFQQHPIFGGTSYFIIPLHSHSSREDQRKIFDPVSRYSIMKIILSTNIAETSITINDVVYVIDSCKTEVKLFTSNNITTYTTMWASKMNLEQRKRRAGRVRPGFCFHLCSKARFQEMDEHMTPEMFRTPLHKLALNIKLLRLGNIQQFLSKAIEPPPIDAVIKAEIALREMKCLDKNDELTPLGKILARLPIELRLGYMVVLACMFRVGDALSTMIANNITVPNVYNIGTLNMRRISAQQKWFAGARCCDHSAMFHAFQAWDKQIADDDLSLSLPYKNLNESSLQIALEIKNYLQWLLQIIGFPKETLCPTPLNYAAVADPNLDTITALLCMGLYPNVCVHKEKREVLTKESTAALIHKTSVNCTPFEQNFLFPFFVFRERIRTREAVSCKQMTMVSPIHLLFFASRKVEYVDGVIRLDNWINLDMNPQHAAAIVALRPALESLVVKVSKDPKTILKLSPTEEKMLSLIKSLCSMNACSHELEQIIGGNFQSSRSPVLTGFRSSSAKVMRRN